MEKQAVHAGFIIYNHSKLCWRILILIGFPLYFSRKTFQAKRNMQIMTNNGWIYSCPSTHLPPSDNWHSMNSVFSNLLLSEPQSKQTHYKIWQIMTEFVPVCIKATGTATPRDSYQLTWQEFRFLQLAVASQPIGGGGGGGLCGGGGGVCGAVAAGCSAVLFFLFFSYEVFTWLPNKNATVW